LPRERNCQEKKIAKRKKYAQLNRKGYAQQEKKEKEKMRDPRAKKMRAMLKRPIPTPKLRKLY
jgi:hypothetical protein